MRWLFQASVSECSKPRLCRLLLCILPSPYRFLNTCHSHHTGSSSHLGIPCLPPSISECHKRSSAHLGVACLRPRLPLTFGCGPTRCPSTHRSSSSFQITVSLLGWTEVVFPSPLGATTPSSSAPSLHTLSTLHIPQIRDVSLPTAPRLPAVSLCKS